MIGLEVFVKLVGNKMDLVWKFVGSFSNTSLNKSSWNNCLVLKRTDSSPERLAILSSLVKLSSAVGFDHQGKDVFTQQEVV